MGRFNVRSTEVRVIFVLFIFSRDRRRNPYFNDEFQAEWANKNSHIRRAKGLRNSRVISMRYRQLAEITYRTEILDVYSCA